MKSLLPELHATIFDYLSVSDLLTRVSKVDKYTQLIAKSNRVWRVRYFDDLDRDVWFIAIVFRFRNPEDTIRDQYADLYTLIEKREQLRTMHFSDNGQELYNEFLALWVMFPHAWMDETHEIKRFEVWNPTAGKERMSWFWLIQDDTKTDLHKRYVSDTNRESSSIVADLLNIENRNSGYNLVTMDSTTRGVEVKIRGIPPIGFMDKMFATAAKYSTYALTASIVSYATIEMLNGSEIATQFLSSMPPNNNTEVLRVLGSLVGWMSTPAVKSIANWVEKALLTQAYNRMAIAGHTPLVNTEAIRLDASKDDVCIFITRPDLKTMLECVYVLRNNRTHPYILSVDVWTHQRGTASERMGCLVCGQVDGQMHRCDECTNGDLFCSKKCFQQDLQCGGHIH